MTTTHHDHDEVTLVSYDDDTGDFGINLVAAIDNGSAWKLEGSVGRAAMDLIESGLAILGSTSHRDYWGNFVPAWWMVDEGTVGSPEYCIEVSDGEFDREIPDGHATWAEARAAAVVEWKKTR